MRSARLALLAAGACMGVSAAAQAQTCPAPRVSQWASVRDTLWPLLEHRDGDQAWAHREPVPLPRGSEAWCNPLQQDPSARQAGRDLFRDVCASCHGDEGKGNGPGAGPADPPPSDFTRAAFAGMREPPGPALLYAIVTRGIAGTAMTGHPALSGWERLAVLAYITSLPGSEAVRASRAWADSLDARRPR